MGESWQQREDIRKELRLIRESMERIDALSQSMLKVQRLIATELGGQTEAVRARETGET